MLLLSEEVGNKKRRILQALGDGKITIREAGEQILELDPHSRGAYALVGAAFQESGELDRAESVFWQGLEHAPCTHVFYASIAKLRQGRDANDTLGVRLRELSLWKLSFLNEIPEEISGLYEPILNTELDLRDPESYEILAIAYAAQHKQIDPPDVAKRLLPYRLLNQLQQRDLEQRQFGVVDECLKNAKQCLPLWHAALRETMRSFDEGEEDFIGAVIALIGETDRPDAVDDLLELMTKTGAVFLHTHWAIQRLAQRFPDAVLEKFRASIATLPVISRCAIADHIGLMEEGDDRVPVLLALLEGFPDFAEEDDASYLLFAVSDVLKELGLEDQANVVLSKYSKMLSKAGRQWVDQQLKSKEPFLSRLSEADFEDYTIHDVVAHCMLLEQDDADEDEDGIEEFDEDDWEEDEDENEPYVAPVRPGRNEPCWCGSGKKYKKCHAASDEEADRQVIKADSPPKAQEFCIQVFDKVIGSIPEIQTRPDLEEGARHFFGRDPSMLKDSELQDLAFADYLFFEHRAMRSGRLIPEEYLRRRGDRLSSREKSLIEEFAKTRFGLLEVLKLRGEDWAEVREAFDDRVFTVSTSSLIGEPEEGDYLLARTFKFEGTEWVTIGSKIVDEPLGFALKELVEKESETAGVRASEYALGDSGWWYRAAKKLLRRPKFA